MTTFEKTDQFALRDFSLRLNAFLSTEHHFVEGGLVISLNAPFGAGKTTFLEMWRNDLLEHRERESLPLPILLNAWETDYSGDPLLSLVSALSTALSTSKDASSRSNGNKLREAAKDAAWYTVGLAGGVASHLSGIDPVAAGEFAEKRKRARNQQHRKSDLLLLYEERTRSLENLKQALIASFGGKDLKAIVMVDELDRCRPTYAIDYLETIKHVFDVHGLSFILAIDKPQLRSSAKALFGTDLNFEEYYRKFVHRNVALPFPSEEGIRRLAISLSETVLEVQNESFIRSSSLNIKHRLNDIVELAIGLQLTPRQLHEAFRLMGHALACAPEQRDKLLWCYGAASVLLACLSVSRPELYDRIGRGLATTQDISSLLRLIPKERHRQWWSAIILTGYTASDQNEYKARHKEFVDAGLLGPETLEENNRSLGEFAQGWGGHHTTNGFRFAYDTIEAVKRFSSRD